MVQPTSYFHSQLMNGQTLCLLPISRLLIQDILLITDDMVIYPPNHISSTDLNLVWWPAFGYSEIRRRNTICDGVLRADGDDLHWFKSAATCIGKEDLFCETLVAVVADISWSDFVGPPSHEFHLECISNAISVAEPQMDRIRFHYCNPDVPQALPGFVGFSEQSKFTAGIFYTLADNESYLVAGELVPSELVNGLGLELSCQPQLADIGDGEVGKLVKHALRMYSEALMATSDTMKFILLMNLIEFISCPFEYMKMQDVRWSHIVGQSGSEVKVYSVV